MDEKPVPKTCWFVIIIIVVIVLVVSIVVLVMWDGISPTPPPPKPPEPSNTTDEFTFSQLLSTVPNQSNSKEVNVSNGTVLGDVRQIFLPPPTNQPSQVLINDGKLRYEYTGDGSNGFEARWLDYVTTRTQKHSGTEFFGTSTVKVVDLGDVETFTVDISALNLSNGGTFTLQMNVKDISGIESSVIDIVTSPKTAMFNKNSFIGNEPGQRPDFSNITGIWLGGDFRAGGGNITMHPLRFVRSLS
uniref:Uncharacterized protein n=1 Tax=Pithovirus LCPAC304 TaxID=2506594 RepID=A0A481Z781_9VIRU|nr:MAG: hypothetical protein LCPAC304_00440 [Pithovirus LCPAC304]